MPETREDKSLPKRELLLKMPPDYAEIRSRGNNKVRHNASFNVHTGSSTGPHPLASINKKLAATASNRAPDR